MLLALLIVPGGRVYVRHTCTTFPCPHGDFASVIQSETVWSTLECGRPDEKLDWSAPAPPPASIKPSSDPRPGSALR